MTTSLLIDTASLAYRAFHALPASITDAEGHAVNAVRGYLDMVSSVLVDVRPEVVRHCWDDAEIPAVRLASYPQYKADRRAAPSEIVWQFDLLRRLLPALGETIVEAPGWEADDAIATLSEVAGADDRVVVLTGDRDLIQLVRDPVVQVWFTVSGTKQLKRYDEAAVSDKYGIAPSAYADFAILRGDPSDGLPGVPGVGEKTARRLVTDHGSVAAVLAAADSQTPRLAQTLSDSTEYVAAMQEVVPVRRDVALRTVGPTSDPSFVQQLSQRHALSGPIDRWQERRA